MLKSGNNAEEKRTMKQIIVYLLVGGGSALFELLLFQGLYMLTPIGVAASNIIAVVCATALNFALNGTVTFKQSGNLARSIVLYLALFAFNTFFSTSVIALLVQIGWPSVLAKILTMGCIVCWNFVLYKKVIFK